MRYIHSMLKILLQRYWAQRRCTSLFEGNNTRNFSLLQKEESGHPSGCFPWCLWTFNLWSVRRYPGECCLLYTVISSKAESFQTLYTQHHTWREEVGCTVLNSMPYLGLGLMKARSHGRFYSYLYWTSSDNVPNSPGLFGFRFSTKPQVRLKTIMGSPGPYFPI